MIPKRIFYPTNHQRPSDQESNTLKDWSTFFRVVIGKWNATGPRKSCEARSDSQGFTSGPWHVISHWKGKKYFYPYIYKRIILCNKNTVAAFRGMHVSPAKHSYAWLRRKRDYRTDRRTKWSLCTAMLRRRHNYPSKRFHCYIYFIKSSLSTRSVVTWPVSVSLSIVNFSFTISEEQLVRVNIIHLLPSLEGDTKICPTQKIHVAEGEARGRYEFSGWDKSSCLQTNWAINCLLYRKL